MSNVMKIHSATFDLLNADGQTNKTTNQHICIFLNLFDAKAPGRRMSFWRRHTGNCMQKLNISLIIKILPHAYVRVVKESGQQSVDHNTIHLKAPYQKNQQLVAH